MEKIEIDVPQIDPQLVVNAMAERLLADTPDYDEEGNPIETDRYYRKKIGQRLREYLDHKVGEMAAAMVRERFEQVVGDRIAATVDAVLAEGWLETNRYGEPTGKKMTLKERVAHVIQARDNANDRDASVDGRVRKAIDDALRGEFAPLIAAARDRFKAELDNAILAKFAEVVRGALGLR